MRTILMLALCFWAGLSGVFAQDKGVDKKPRLIVGIVIDQMRYDIIYKYWNKFENNGFKRLINEGTVCKNAQYHFMVSKGCISYSTIVTGANPCVHGIISDDWYLRLSDKIVHCTKDTTVTTLGGTWETGRHSPRNLLVTTVGDELRFSSNKASKVISMSLDASNAVLAGGHAPNAAYWLDPESGSMITSTFYMQSPTRWMEEFNRKKLADAYLDRSWEPINPLTSYTDSSSIMDDNFIFRGQKKFPYDLRKAATIKDRRNYSLLKYTPFGINYLKDFAIASIVNEQLGKDDVTDMLCIGFTSPGTVAQTFGLNSVEMEDTYIRLDKEIRHLLDFLDSYVGKGNVLVFLTSSQGAAYSPSYMQQNGVSTGYFNPYQSVALLRSYMNALYGTQDLIKHYNNLQFYINQNKVRELKLSFDKVQQEMADFLTDFTGVHHVMISGDMQHQGFTEGVNQMIQNSYHAKRSGDIIVYLEPGWLEKKNDSYNYISASSSETHVPLIWYGWKVKKKNIYREVDMTDIAPTISTLLDISYPNGCQGKAILEIIE